MSGGYNWPMESRLNVSTAGAWEEMYGYSRAVRTGSLVEVSGTTAVDEAGDVVGAGDMYAQARFVLRKIEKALIEAGAELSDVVRTRAFLADFSMFEDLARAHREVFADIRPAATAVEARLVRPDLLVEIEATAVVTGSRDEVERGEEMT